jgi:beta-hydroxylase
MLPDLLAPKFLLVYAFAACTAYVHFRGKVRHPFHVQLTEHSTFFAPYNALMYLFSAVPNRPFQDMQRFPDLAPLRENWRAIRDEAQALFSGGHIRAAASYNDLAFNSFYRTGWKRFYVKWYDEAMPSAQALCPKTTALVESIPSLNAAMFTMLPPGARLVSHRDPYAGSLRYHLGLVTPNTDDCYINVDGQNYSWRDGQAVMFDETFIHYAENKSDKPRLILFCDVERPMTNRFMAWVNKGFKKYVARATETQNVPGERVGFLNRVFEVVYRVRILTKKLKSKTTSGYYVLKWALLGGIAYLIFA